MALISPISVSLALIFSAFTSRSAFVTTSSVLEAGSSWIFLGEPSATVSSVLELVHGQAYSKLSYYSLVLNGEADKNSWIDPGAMILGVTSLCRNVRRKCYFADGGQNTRWNRHTDDTRPGRPSIDNRYQSERLSLT